MRSRQIIFLIFVILWMGIVFWFSNQGSSDSDSTSGNTIRAILSIMPSFRDLAEEEKLAVIKIMQPIARKLAHFSVYAVGGVLMLLYFNECKYKENNKLLCSILLGFAYAIFDEIHQTFVPRKSRYGN